MGFWHTGYEGFHEPEETRVWVPRKPKPATFHCSRCDLVFASRGDLAVHEFDGHATSRPLLTLHGRECGRTRLAVIAPTQPNDWGIENARSVRVNGGICSEEEARRALTSTRTGVVSVTLDGDAFDQQFEFKFDIADNDDLDGVDEGLHQLIQGKALTINAIDGFIRTTDRFATGRSYRDSLANYFYGVLAREQSPQAGFAARAGSTRYTRQFDEAVAELGRYERPPAEAISGLVAFHYNQFDLALRKTRSPRIAQVALRFASLLNGQPSTAKLEHVQNCASLDYILSDNEIERVIHWTSIALDGSACHEIVEMEEALTHAQPADAMKMRIVLTEHYLAAAEPGRSREHLAVLRHTKELEKWIERCQTRTGDKPRD